MSGRVRHLSRRPEPGEAGSAAAGSAAFGVPVAEAPPGLPVHVSVAWDDRKGGGSFEVGISFEAVCGLLALPSLAMVPVSLAMVHEERPRSLPACREYASGVWRLLSSSFFLSVVLFSVLYSAIGGIGSPAGIGVQRYWGSR